MYPKVSTGIPESAEIAVKLYVYVIYGYDPADKNT